MVPTRRSAVVAAALWGLFVAGSVADEAINVWLPWDRIPSYLNVNNNAGATGALGTVAMLAFITVGALLLWRRPANRVGWLLCAIPYSAIIPLGTMQTYLGLGWYLHPGTYPPGSDAYFAISSVTWWIPFTLIMVVLPLIFPTGRLPSPRWRLVFIGVALYGLAFTSDMFNPDLAQPPRMRNPLALAAATNWIHFWVLFTPLMFGCLLAAIASVVVRYRRASNEERHQLKWFAAAIALVAAAFILEALIPGLPNFPALPLFFCGVPIAIGVAIFRYRLYDIDVVINRSLVFGALALFIAGIYVAVVVGVGRLIGSGGRPNLALSIVATALVAIAFQPVRERVETVANRLVYGQRLSPYEALARLSERASVRRGEDVLAEMARVLAQGTSAERATVWLRSGDEFAPAAVWPVGTPPVAEDATRRAEVHHQGKLLGELAVRKPAGEPLTAVEEGLLADMAAQAGLLLHNVRLDAELRQRLDQISRQTHELRESRQRIVAAQDQERRRLERNIHDGAQQHLVALSVKLRLASNLAQRAPEKAEALMVELKQETAVARERLRELASGIYPPLLRERGVGAALAAHAASVPFHLHVRDELTLRYTEELEAAVYFCCLEALQNVAKYAGAENAWVTLREHAGSLEFEVKDDGRGFDGATVTYGSGVQNMRDRLQALGGKLWVESRSGEGTRVTGSLQPATRDTRHAEQPVPAGGQPSGLA